MCANLAVGLRNCSSGVRARSFALPETPLFMERSNSVAALCVRGFSRRIFEFEFPRLLKGHVRSVFSRAERTYRIPS